MIDLRGIQLSRWNPTTGDLGSKAPPKITRDAPAKITSGFDDEKDEKAFKQIAGLVSDGELASKVWAVVQALIAAKERQAKGVGVADTLQPLITKSVAKAIKQTIHEELKELKEMNSKAIHMVSKASAPTWAQRAATGLPPTKGSASSFNLKPVPARLSREVIIRVEEIAEDIRKRTPAETVQAVNTALRTDAAKAARRLNSGDIVVTFNTQSARFCTNTSWVQAAFGDAATLTPRVYSVVVKGVSRDLARDYEDLKKRLSQANNIKILKIKAMRPRSEDSTKLNLILGLASPEEANMLCRNEVFIDAQVFRCEPYEESLQPRQCYQCFQFGHIARHCRAVKRCGHCAAAAHPGGEPSCPVKTGVAGAKCML